MIESASLRSYDLCFQRSVSFAVRLSWEALAEFSFRSYSAFRPITDAEIKNYAALGTRPTLWIPTSGSLHYE